MAIQKIILLHLKAVWIYIAQTTLKISNKITKQPWRNSLLTTGAPNSLNATFYAEIRHNVN